MIIWNKISTICARINFPDEAIATLETAYRKIMEKSADKIQAVATKWLNPNDEWKQCLEDLSVIAKETDVSVNVVRMVFFLYCAIPLRAEYETRGLNETIYWQTMQDLRCKMIECHNLYGEWGTFVPDWYRSFYVCERFALGRLQYEKMLFPYDNYKNLLKKGDTVLNCHIPSSGALKENDVLESFQMAYKFYQAELIDGILPITCHSWLLYEPFKETFADSHNVQKFRDMFDVIDNETNERNSDFWRVFNKEFSKETLQTFSPVTKLQKRMQDYLLQGNCMGYGFGVILFDGEKIINR